MNTLMITGTLTTRTALHSGAGAGGGVTDAQLRRTAAGALIIPGSAIAGALRALATRVAPRLNLATARPVCKTLEARPDAKKTCACPVCHLFGEFYPQAPNVETTGGRAARLWVYDAVLTPNDLPPTTWIRDGVGIDRASGAAARQGAIKFDLEVLPARAQFKLQMELEDATPEDEQLLAATLAEWQAGRGAVGGRTARGLGAFTLEAITCQQQQLDTPKDLMAYLRGAPTAGVTPRADWLSSHVATARAHLRPLTHPQISPEVRPHIAQSWLELEFTLQATGPLLVNDPTRAGLGGFNHAPLVEGERPVIPGASLRGVLRSHAERIARTLATAQAANFLQQCPACSPVARPTAQEDLPLESCDTLLQRREEAELRDPAQEVSETEQCLACRLFGSPRLGSRLRIEDAYIKEGATLHYKVQDFLAIDRFTGGGRDGAKFDALALWRPAFTARLYLENPRAWELGWLALVLRDLAEGWLTVGFGAAKGFGKVTVPEWTARIGLVQPEDFPANVCMEPLTKEPPEETERLQALRQHLQTQAVETNALYRLFTLQGTVAARSAESDAAWDVPDPNIWQAQVNAWIRAFRAEVTTFERTPQTLPGLRADSYFLVTAEGLRDNPYYPQASVAWQEVSGNE